MTPLKCLLPRSWYLLYCPYIRWNPSFDSSGHPALLHIVLRITRTFATKRVPFIPWERLTKRTNLWGFMSSGYCWCKTPYLLPVTRYEKIKKHQTPPTAKASMQEKRIRFLTMTAKHEPWEIVNIKVRGSRNIRFMPFYKTRLASSTTTAQVQWIHCRCLGWTHEVSLNI